ncbi:MAG TPA: RluA family pseudouridine synthase [Planctomycetota bacterium]|nr:RluA family pseudouridine synthase [Planctomycetota bacterium]
MAIVHKRFDVTPELAGRVDRVVQALTGLSRSEIRGLFDHGCITINSAPCSAIGEPVRAGDVVEAVYDIHRRYHERRREWEDEAFRIAFEDKHLIVVDKSAGFLTVPAQPGDTSSLLHAVSRYMAHRGLRERAQPVHRLDRDVSGLLVFGKSRLVAEKLQAQFESRKPEREYAAIVKGAVPASGTFESYLATSKSLQRYSTEEPGEGQLAITHYKRVKVVHGASYVRVWLETGRRNQIRVHFAEAGHPVLGDPRYRPELSSHPQWRARRLALHAAVLGFEHPVSGKALRFESELPAPMRGFIGEKRAKRERR